MVFVIRQRLAGRNDNRLTGMDTKRVHILHITYCDTIVGGIAHDLVLDFFIVMQILLDQDLGSKRQRPADNMA